MPIVRQNIYIAVDFGTSRSGFAYILHGEDINKDVKSFRNWEGASVPYDKTLTQILYDPNGKPISFGYSVPKKYSELIYSVDNVNEYSLFRFFKMDLQESTNPNGILVNEHTGREFSLVHVIADYLMYIRGCIEKVTGVDLKLNRDTVRWCFTVPAIWTDDEKQKTKEACVLAGFIDDIHAHEDDFLFAPEPEAAAAYCLSTLQQNNQIVNGETFLVCDAGGGTVDLTSHQLVKEGSVLKLKAMTRGGGGACGSSYLDKKFIQVMREVFGEGLIDNLKTQQPTLYEEFLGLWEKKKVEIEDINQTQFILLIGPLKDYFTDNLDPANDNGKKKFRNSRIILDSTILHSIFDDVLQQIDELIMEEVGMLRRNFNNLSKEFNYIFVVGGFGESKVLQNLITEKYQSVVCKVVCPPGPGGAIVKGAVMLGVDPSLIVTRRMRRAYGVTSFKKFVNGVHDTSKRVRLKGRKEDYCKEVFDIFVDVDEEVKYDQVIVREYGVADDKQQSMVLELYMSAFPNTQYVTESHVRKCGEILIDMKGTSGMNRMVQVSMFFGKSEIEIRAYDKTTSKQYKASIDFDKNKFQNHSSSSSSSQISNETYHFIFVNDKSGSMGSSDATPQSSRFSNDRLGALFESCEKLLDARGASQDIVSCIMYDSSASTYFSAQPIDVSLVNRMATCSAGGGTCFTSAMNAVSSLLSSTYTHYPSHKTIVVFMSDGEDDASQAIQITAQLVSRYAITLHAVQLGGSSDNPGLQSLASTGRGEFKRAKDAASLAAIYESIANHPVAN